MNISELMTPNPISLLPDDSILEKVNVFEDNNIHHIPVVTEAGDIIGMVSSKDVENITSVMGNISEFNRSILVKDVMTKPVFSFYEDVDIKQAARAMVDNNINAIVVVNKSENIIGIITSTDLLKYIADL